MNTTVFVLDIYNPYMTDDVRYVFRLNERYWCIKEVELEWGVPQITETVDNEVDPHMFHLYNTYEEALEAVKFLQEINR